MFAPMILDTAIGTAHAGLRFQADYGLATPDRAQYYWGKDSASETNVDAQDLVFRMELGNEHAMALTQYTLRTLNPDHAPNTTGFGDMVVGAKVTMLNGRRLKVASIFRTYLATGSSGRGLGTGHTSLEPGVLTRYCLSPRTFLFGELKYWVPIGGTTDVKGDVLTTGLAISTIWHESDVFALMPTMEFRTLSFVSGGSTRPGYTDVDGDTALEIYPGARMVFGPEGDLGLWEFGCAAGFTVGDDQWFDTRMMFDLRWNY